MPSYHQQVSESSKSEEPYWKTPHKSTPHCFLVALSNTLLVLQSLPSTFVKGKTLPPRLPSNSKKFFTILQRCRHFSATSQTGPSAPCEVHKSWKLCWSSLSNNLLIPATKQLKAEQESNQKATLKGSFLAIPRQRDPLKQEIYHHKQGAAQLCSPLVGQWSNKVTWVSKVKFALVPNQTLLHLNSYWLQ